MMLIWKSTDLVVLDEELETPGTVLTWTPLDLVGRTALLIELGVASEIDGSVTGVEVNEQIVVVTLTTVVDVRTTVALAGQLTASVAHLVTV